MCSWCKWSVGSMLSLGCRNVIPGKSFKTFLLSVLHIHHSKDHLGIVPVIFFIQPNGISIWLSIMPRCFLFKKSWYLCCCLGQDWITLKKSLNCLWRWGPQQFLSWILLYFISWQSNALACCQVIISSILSKKYNSL